jgi:hypothetical protein
VRALLALVALALVALALVALALVALALVALALVALALVALEVVPFGIGLDCLYQLYYEMIINCQTLTQTLTHYLIFI